MNRIIAFMAALLIIISGCACAEELPVVEDSVIVGQSVTTGHISSKTDTNIVVQIDNEPGARPQLGISCADIVYEMPVYNGGYTRYTAVFNDTIPEEVEAVRSTRMLNVDIYLDHGGAFVHFGGQDYSGTNVFEYMKTVNMQARYDGLSNSVFFYRDNGRSAPNNVVAKLGGIAADIDWTGIESKSPLHFDENAWTSQGAPAAKFGVKYRSGYEPSYEYIDGVYYRNYNGQAHIDGMTDTQLTCSNVIIRQMDYSWYDGASDRPVVKSVGSGKCDYFIGGMHFTGYWERTSLDNNTVYYTDDGAEVVFRPGKTYIQIITGNEEVTIAE